MQASEELVKLHKAQHEAIIKSPYFIEWFGDWETPKKRISDKFNKLTENQKSDFMFGNDIAYQDCSCVISPELTPRIVYHGTDLLNFYYFNFFQFPYAYFSPDIEYANNFGQWIYPFYLNMKNPCYLSHLGAGAIMTDELAERFEEKGVSREIFYKVVPLEVPYIQVFRVFRNDKAGMIKNALRRAGYDGVVIQELIKYDDETEEKAAKNKKTIQGSTAFLCFTAPQIKSPANNLTFDSTNPHFHFDGGGSVPTMQSSAIFTTFFDYALFLTYNRLIQEADESESFEMRIAINTQFELAQSVLVSTIVANSINWEKKKIEESMAYKQYKENADFSLIAFDQWTKPLHEKTIEYFKSMNDDSGNMFENFKDIIRKTYRDGSLYRYCKFADKNRQYRVRIQTAIWNLYHTGIITLPQANVFLDDMQASFENPDNYKGLFLSFLQSTPSMSQMLNELKQML